MNQLQNCALPRFLAMQCS